MKKIHVLHVLNSAYGGSALSTFELIDELKRQDIRSSLICFNNADQKQVDVIQNLVEGRVLFIPLYWTNKRIRVKWWKRPLLEAYTIAKTWKGYKYQRQIDSFIKKNEVNIVHTSTILNPEGAIAAKRNNLAHVWHVRELIGPKTHYRFWNYRKWSASVIENCDMLIANSTITKNNLLNFFPESKIEYIPNGIETHKFTPKHHVQQQRLVVGMVGNVTSQWKNHEFFIKTSVVLTGNSEFRIYGSLPRQGDAYYNHLVDFIRKNNLGSRVKFVGHHNQPWEIMKEIDVLFHPTGLESFGRIFAEAMAGGIPIVAVQEGGALELVENDVNGYLIKENDVLAAAKNIQKLFESAELRNLLGSNGRIKVEKSYTLSRAADRISDMYKKLTEEN